MQFVIRSAFVLRRHVNIPKIIFRNTKIRNPFSGMLKISNVENTDNTKFGREKIPKIQKFGKNEKRKNSEKNNWKYKFIVAGTLNGLVSLFLISLDYSNHFLICNAIV